jgi:hypothetical protein
MTMPGRTVPGHKISWWVYPTGPNAGYNPERIRHTAQMRGWVAWDATCECGWDSKTGGAVRSSVERDVWGHKWDAVNEQFQTQPR